MNLVGNSKKGLRSFSCKLCFLYRGKDTDNSINFVLQQSCEYGRAQARSCSRVTRTGLQLCGHGHQHDLHRLRDPLGAVRHLFFLRGFVFVPGQVFNFVDMAANVVFVVFTILQARCVVFSAFVLCMACVVACPGRPPRDVGADQARCVL